MQPIIVATDFSPAALNAVHYACDLAVALDAPLILLNVYQVAVATGEPPMILVPIDELGDHAERRLRSLRDDLHHITSGNLRIDIEARAGDVAEEIEACCKINEPFIAVLGTSGHSSVGISVFGSTALSVFKHVKYPILIVPKGTAVGNGVRKIAAAWDYTGDMPLPQALFDVLKTLTAEVHVVRVHRENAVTENHPSTASTVRSLEPFNPIFHQVTHHNIAEGINTFAEQNNIDIIITFARAHHFPESLFHKNQTKGFISNPHFPILCIHH